MTKKTEKENNQDKKEFSSYGEAYSFFFEGLTKLYNDFCDKMPEKEAKDFDKINELREKLLFSPSCIMKIKV